MSNYERIVTKHFGAKNPSDVADYMRDGGYQGLRRAIAELGTGRTLEDIARSRLRGRGGAGFDAATKWRTVCEANGQPKYVVCNAYDADPNTPISKTLLEQSPHTILEGMLIAAFAVGASYGVVYCRGDATSEVAAMKDAIEQAREQHVLGFNVLGSEFDFDVSVSTGWGGFIGAEETAMLMAIRGKRAMPNQKPPYPAQSGLDNRPTLVHSAETLAAVPWIIMNGGEAFARIGTELSTGTKMVQLAGDVRNRALVELPFGTPIREAVMDVGQGLAKGRTIKAVHVGGPLGGVIPAPKPTESTTVSELWNLLDTPLDYEALAGLGASVGLGRITVLNEETCMVGYTQQVLRYLAQEACGKCVPCRVGTKRIATIVEGFTSNLGKAEDLDLTAEIARYMFSASLCHFGMLAPAILTTSLKYFPEEYTQHIEGGKCPTGQCQPTRNYRYQKRAVL